MNADSRTKDLTRKAVRGVAWTGGSQLIRQPIAIITSIALARILLPEHFGLIGMTMVFVGISQLIADFGIGAAIVQKDDVSPLTLSSAFWANVLVGGVLVLLLMGASPLVAKLYGDPNVRMILIALSLQVFLASLVVVPRSILFRYLDFKSISIAEVIGSLASSIAAIGLALAGAGVWSLVAQPIVGNVVALAVTWQRSKWIPSFSYSWGSIRELVFFSGGILGSSLLNYVSRSADKLIIGRVLGKETLGYYSLAYTLMLYPLGQISGTLVKVLFPTLSSLKNDPHRFARAYVRTLSAISILTFPAMLGLLAISHDFVLVVFGAKWLPMEPVLRVFCVIGILQSIGTTVGTIYLSLGRIKQVFYVTLVTTPILVSIFALSVRFGILGVAYAYAAFNFSFLYISFWFATRGTLITIGTLFSAVIRKLICALLMLATLIGLGGPLSHLTPVSRMTTMIIVGATIYCVLMLMVDRREINAFRALVLQSFSKDN